jgi:hypothetical protein
MAILSVVFLTVNPDESQSSTLEVATITLSQKVIKTQSEFPLNVALQEEKLVSVRK